MKKTLVVIAALSSLTLAAGQAVAAPAEIKTEDDKILYTLGTIYGSRLDSLALTEREIDLISQGLADAAGNRGVKVELADGQSKVKAFFEARQAKAAEVTKSEGKAYLERFVSQEGGLKTASGLAYKIMTPGTGKRPAATDVVKVHYEGRLISGMVFDSSRKRNAPVEFPLNKVIKGWTEGMQLVGEGGRITLVIPSELAYGDPGAPPTIPGGATLVFDVELLEVKKTELGQLP